MKIRHLILPMVSLLCLSNDGITSEIVDEPSGIFANVRSRYDHTALPYNAEMKDEVKQFYGKTLGLPVKDAGKKNLLVDFLGINLVFHASKEPIPSSMLYSDEHPIPHLHFGTQSLTLDEFQGVEKAVNTLNIKVNTTQILNQGLDNEERTLFFKDPIGYVIECRYTKKPLNFDPNIKLVMDNEKKGFSQ